MALDYLVSIIWLYGTDNMVSFNSKIIEKRNKNSFLSYTEGVNGFYTKLTNPYEKGSKNFIEWEDGYLDAEFLFTLTGGVNA